MVALARELGLAKLTLSNGMVLEIGDLPTPEPKEMTAAEITEAQQWEKRNEIAEYLCLEPEDIVLPGEG